MATKRQRIDTGRGGIRSVRHGGKGQLKEVESAGRSLKQDRASEAMHATTSGQGDKGDRKISGARAGKGRRARGRKS